MGKVTFRGVLLETVIAFVVFARQLKLVIHFHEYLFNS